MSDYNLNDMRKFVIIKEPITNKRSNNNNKKSESGENI